MDAIEVMTDAIAKANVNFPLDIRGHPREQRILPHEEAVHLTNAAIFGLLKAGYKIVKIEGALDAPSPKPLV
jgi:hypothetical protein